MPQPITSSHRQLLEWIAARPRTYAEVMDAWRSTCPRLTIWEDVLDAGYVRIETNGRDLRSAAVSLTAAGESVAGQ